MYCSYNERYVLKLCTLTTINIYVHIGRHELDDTKILCEGCGTDIILDGFWPGSVERHSQYLFDVDMFLFFDYLQKYNPGLSMSGFIHSLEQFSAVKGRVCFLHLYIHTFPPAYPKKLSQNPAIFLYGCMFHVVSWLPIILITLLSIFHLGVPTMYRWFILYSTKLWRI